MEEPKETKTWIVHVSTYPPRECGIATFTQDLVSAFDDLYLPREESKVIAMTVDETDSYDYPRRVIHTIAQHSLESYIKAADMINSMSHVKVVNIQHEFGIYGGEDGKLVLEFMKKLTKPITVTCHTVLPGPNEHIKQVVIDIAALAGKMIPMTETSRKLLAETYGISEEKIAVIPHGIHSMPYTKHGSKSKSAVDLSDKLVLSTFGLLSRGKGIEYAIDAMPAIVKEFPNAMYCIIGATHPVVQRNEGEEYRKFLTKKVFDLGLKDNVRFYNQYLDTPKLLQFLDASDVYLSLSQNPNQAVSGTLSYALGAGRPVISTAFAQAKEEITSDVGILVDFTKPEEISAAALKLFRDPLIRETMGKNAYFRTRNRTWHNVALAFMREFISLAPVLGKKEKNLPRIKLSHFETMTDNFGMFQFATLMEPDKTSGYTLDDNARALIAVTLFYEKCGGSAPLRLAEIYMKCLEFMLKPDGSFHNYVDFDRTIPSRNSVENLDDANARAFYAITSAATSEKLPEELKEKAKDLLDRIILPKEKHSPRAIAFYIKGFCNLEKTGDFRFKNQLSEYSDFLINIFHAEETDGWNWFENSMTYSNGVLPDALLHAFKITNKHDYFDVAKKSLDFLLEQSFSGDICEPIGQRGWLKKGSKKGLHDQQPEEVAALVEALSIMHQITNDPHYVYKMRQAFNWFLGNNLLHQVVYDQASGGCFDGLGEHQVNLNQGAESTVVYLIARLHM